MKEIVDVVWDSIALGRKSVRVTHKRPEIETGETYLISFLLNLDKVVHDELVAEAERQQRQVDRVIRDYVRYGLKICFQDAEEEEQKAA